MCRISTFSKDIRNFLNFENYSTNVFTFQSQSIWHQLIQKGNHRNYQPLPILRKMIKSLRHGRQGIMQQTIETFLSCIALYMLNTFNGYWDVLYDPFTDHLYHHTITFHTTVYIQDHRYLY